MIDQVDSMLSDWVRSVLPESAVSLALPGSQKEPAGVGLYLFELANAPVPHGGKRPPLQIHLRYLVTTWSKDAQEAHRLLGQLAFSAMERTDFELDFTPLPAELWAAMDATPRASFVLQLPVRHERAEIAAPLVRQPLRTQMVPAMTFTGRLLGPGDVPLARAHIELPLMSLSTQSDSRGYFRFLNIPAEPTIKQVRIRTKGQVYTVDAKPPPDATGVTIRLQLTEE